MLKHRTASGMAKQQGKLLGQADKPIPRDQGDLPAFLLKALDKEVK